MKKLLLTPILFISLISFGQWRVDFGVEAQVNQNKVQKWIVYDKYDPNSTTLEVVDVIGDTMGIFFNKFTMSNNFEIPIYFRLNRNRHFIDFKLSNSINTLKMEGYANYNLSFYEQNYGTYADFEAQAIADGLTDIDQADYEAYLNVARKDWESDITYTQTFQLLSLTVNYGYRFLPHKSIKPFVAGGLTVKGKYRKANYDYLRFSNDFIEDLSAINDAINDFAEISVYSNLAFGFELYRFRMAAYLQYGIGYAFPEYEYEEDQITYVNDFTAFDNLFSFGLNIGVDLFRQDFGKNVHKDNVTKDDFEISKIKRKKDKWDFGIRFNRRGFNDLTTFFEDDVAEPSYLSVFRADSAIVNVGGILQEGYNIESARFEDIKRIGWSGQLDVYASVYFGKRWLAELSAGYSHLNFDVETKELTATIGEDSLGTYYVESTGSPRVRSGVYRKGFDLIHFNPSVGFKVIDRDIFDLRLKIGGGITLMLHRFLGSTEQPEGVNELDLYDDVEAAYSWPADGDNVLVNDQWEIDYDLNYSPDDVISNFDPNYTFASRTPSVTQRQWYPTAKFGIEANIDRFSLGMSAETVIGYMDGFMLKNFSTVYFSIGYQIWSR